MRLRTIWTIPACTLTERLRRTRDWAAMTVAHRLLPKRIKYWTVMIEVGKATMDSEDVMATPLDEVLRNLDAPKNLS